MASARGGVSATTISGQGEAWAKGSIVSMARGSGQGTTGSTSAAAVGSRQYTDRSCSAAAVGSGQGASRLASATWACPDGYDCSIYKFHNTDKWDGTRVLEYGQKDITNMRMILTAKMVKSDHNDVNWAKMLNIKKKQGVRQYARHKPKSSNSVHHPVLQEARTGDHIWGKDQL